MTTLQKRDKKHFGDNQPNITILGSFQSFLGRRLPMAVFKNGTYEGNHYTVEPTKWKGFIRKFGIIPVYYVGDIIEWRIKIKPFASNSLPLRKFDIYEDVPPFRLKKIESHCNLENHVLEYTFNRERMLSQEGEAKYWLGLPGESNSIVLVAANVIHNEHKYWKQVDFLGYVVSAIVGGLAGAIVVFFSK